MTCLHCGRKLKTAPTLQNGCAFKHADTQFRLCNPTDPFSPWAEPAPKEAKA